MQAPPGTWPRIADRLRWFFLSGLASAMAGVVVLGIGGRLVMLASRFLHPEAAGRLTENGNRIGEFTFGGTIELVIFGGLLSGLVAGVAWVIVKTWVPDRAWVVGIATTAIGGTALIQSDNRDFTILSGPAPDIALLVSLAFLFGLAIHWLDGLLDRHLPGAESSALAAPYGILSAAALPLASPLFRSFFTEDGCFCADPDVWTGVGLVIAGIASAIWWVLDARGVAEAPVSLRWLGRGGTALAVSAGLYYLSREITEIL